MEHSRREFKIPLHGLCILSTETESMGLPDLRAKLKFAKIFRIDHKLKALELFGNSSAFNVNPL